MDPALIVYAFTAGMLATVNPCGFAMLPAYISYYLATEDERPAPRSPATGATAPEAQVQRPVAGTLARLPRALLVGGALTAGFVVLFALAGTAISLGAYALVRTMPWIGLLIGAGLMLLGAWLLWGHHLAVPGLSQLQLGRQRTLGGIFLFGMAYGLASLSCTLPVFLVVVGSAFTSREIGAGLAQFLAYGLGMGVVLMALTLSLALFKGALLGALKRAVPYVERAGAVLLVAAGAYLVYYWLSAGQLLRPMG
jgi:cytochrome c biogenesis protein CcdA